MLNVR